MRPDRRWDSTAVKLLLVLGSLLLMCVFLEGGARLFYFARWGHLYSIHEREYSLRLGWQNEPGMYRQFRINAQGFRRADGVALHRPRDLVRIFLVGGSTAFGSNGLYPSFPSKPLTDEDTIDYHLQTLLRARHPSRRFEVINAAVSEYRLFQETTLFLEKLINYKPSLVIFLDGHNDASFLTRGPAIIEQSAPLWDNRHFIRGQQVLNSAGPLDSAAYADILLGRVSYFYHGMSALFQALHEQGPWALRSPIGGRAFRLEDEADLLRQNEARLRDLEAVLPVYVAQVRDLKALATVRNTKIVYVLQPEIMVEEPTKLTRLGVRIQEFSFRLHDTLGGTLRWRYLIRRIPAVLSALDHPDFRIVNLTTMADGSPEELYTDYCHLTSAGNRVVAEKLYPVVVSVLGNGGSS